MKFSMDVDVSGIKTLQRFAQSVGSLPQDSRNPLMQALMDYRLALKNKTRPTVGMVGNWFGNTWPALAPQYTRKDGTVVPVWGGVNKVRGRGKVKGRLRSSATGKGKGSRYKQSDAQLGDRSKGLWSDWQVARPVFGTFGKSLTLTSNKAYAAAIAEARNWFGGAELKRLVTRALKRRVIEYIREQKRTAGLR